MASFDLIAIVSGKQKRTPSSTTDIDFQSVRIGASNLPITENSGHFAFGSKQLQSVADPTSAQHAATKAYVDAVRVAARIIGNVNLATTANITLSGEQTIDTVLTSASRVLVKDQTDPKQNGIYLTSSGAWTRTVDFDNSPVGEIYNGVLSAAVLDGSANIGKKYVITSVGTGVDALHTIGTDNITWSAFTADANMVGGNGITVTGNSIAVNHDGDGLQFNGSQLSLELNGSTLSKGAAGLKVAAAGITATELAASVAGAGLTGGAGSALDVNTGEAIKIVSDAVAVDFAKTKTNDNAGSITVRQAVYVKANGNVDLARADVANLETFELGLVEDASIATTASGKITFRRGAIVSGFSGLTPGAKYYVQKATAGAIALYSAITFATGDKVYSVGRALSTTEINFDPQFEFEY